MNNLSLGKWVVRGLLIGAVWAALSFAPVAFLATFAFSFAFLVGFHVALFHTSKPVFEWLLRHEIDFFDISKTGDLYLRRFYLTPRLHLPKRLVKLFSPRVQKLLRSRLFLHWILRSDDDRDPHDHPWAFTSYILYGWYIEKVWFPCSTRKQAAVLAAKEDFRYYPLLDQRAWGRQGLPGFKLVNDALHTHMLEIVQPVWSLVVADEREREWGFWEIDEKKPSKDRWIDQETYKNRGDESRPAGE